MESVSDRKPFFFVGTNRRIYLFGNHLCGAIPPELGQLTKLVKLVLQQNHLSEEIPKELEGLNLGKKTEENGQTLTDFDGLFFGFV